MRAIIRYNLSYIWRSILQAHGEVIDKAGLWKVRDDCYIHIWEHGWMPI